MSNASRNIPCVGRRSFQISVLPDKTIQVQLRLGEIVLASPVVKRAEAERMQKALVSALAEAKK